MMDRRIVSGTCLICLPALAASALTLAGYFLVVAPRFRAQEAKRALAAYRERAEDLKEDPSLGAGVEPARRGTWRVMRPGRWGFFEEGETATVWYLEGTRNQSLVVPREAVAPVDWATFSILLFLLGLLWALTLSGCLYFRASIRVRDDFVAATAHDLTTPLVALRRFIGTNDDEARRMADRLMRLVANLTAFLRLGARRPTPDMKRVDLVKAFSEAYWLVRDDYRWIRAGEDVAVEGPQELFAEGDETQIVQIFWNLLSNDLKYAAPFGPIAVRFEEKGAEAVCVSFLDRGPGMSARDQRKAFTRYYRAKSVLKSGKGGFGIGLSTAREMARAMGGDITVSAREGGGSVFTLVLGKATAS